jgi:hypothetical protein
VPKKLSLVPAGLRIVSDGFVNQALFYRKADMPTELEIQYHRTFLSLHMCRTIYNEDERYQNKHHYPNGPPNRQAKVESNPVFKYHVHHCPRFPQRAPGQPIDRPYGALLARDGGIFDSIVIIPKRGQQFSKVAEPWERVNSILCSEAGEFWPIINSSMEVTGHYANRYRGSVIHPKGIKFKSLAEYIDNGVDIHFRPPGRMPDGWEDLSTTMDWKGHIDLYVLPNGKIVDGEGYSYSANNGTIVPSWSPFDFIAPGRRAGEKVIRSFTNRVSAAGRSAWRIIRPPTKESAQAFVNRLSGKTLTGIAVSGRGMLPTATVGRRTIIFGDDMAGFKKALSSMPSESGFYDVAIHGDLTSFWIKQNGSWVAVSVKDVAHAVRINLAAGDKIRLLACETGLSKSGPAQQLANELQRTVWAPSKPIYPIYGKATKIQRNGSAHIDDFDPSKAVVPIHNGKFYEFKPLASPQRFNANVVKRSGNAVLKK